MIIEGLTEAQSRVVQYEGHALVVACPGSGKTKTMASKAAWVLTCNPEAKVLAVSFTRDSAAELKSRILASVPNPSDVRQRLSVGTFHAIALEQLRRSDIRLKLLSDTESHLMLERAVALTGLDISLEEARQAVDFGLAGGKLPERGPWAVVFQAWQNLMQRVGAHDLGSILPLAVDGMKHGRVRPLMADVILADECQDADDAQLEWLLLHARAGSVVTIVGDDDQAIYGWRKARGHAGMMAFQKALDARLLQLDINFRCRQEILDFAGKILIPVRDRVAKNLKAARGKGGKVSVFFATSRAEEAEAAVRWCAQTPESSTAILVRSNFHLNDLEAACLGQNVAYIRADGESLFDERGATLLVALLKAARLKDDAAMELVLAATGESEKNISRLSKRHGAARTVLNTLDDQKSKQIKNISKTPLREAIGLAADWLMKVFKNQPAVSRSIGPAARVLMKIQNHNNKPQSLTSCLAAIRRRQEKQKNGVILMTMHGSKGLEFDRVWIARAAVGITPHRMGLIDEERRLFYVAATRAKDYLVLSCGAPDMPSPFWQEGNLSLSDHTVCFG